MKIFKADGGNLEVDAYTEGGRYVLILRHWRRELKLNAAGTAYYVEESYTQRKHDFATQGEANGFFVALRAMYPDLKAIQTEDKR